MLYNLLVFKISYIFIYSVISVPGLSQISKMVSTIHFEASVGRPTIQFLTLSKQAPPYLLIGISGRRGYRQVWRNIHSSFFVCLFFIYKVLATWMFRLWKLLTIRMPKRCIPVNKIFSSPTNHFLYN